MDKKSSTSSPFKVLIGPLVHPYLIGAYHQDPQIKIFTLGEEWRRQAHHPQEDDAQLLKPMPHALTLDLEKPEASLQMLWRQLPKDWKPDVLIWWGMDSVPPPDIAQCPCPSILLASQWPQHAWVVRQYIQAFDYVFGDQDLIDTLLYQSFYQIHYWPGVGFHPPAFRGNSDTQRDIDICFVGDFEPALYSLRNRYLRRLAQYGAKNKVRVVIGTEMPRSQYLSLLKRSKLAFNYSLRGEMNQRAFEVAASGALLFQESHHLEITRFLPPGEACVLYTAQNLEQQLHYYLKNDDERRLIAQKGQEAIQAFSYTRQFQRLLGQIKQLWPQLQKKERPWKYLNTTQKKLLRCQQMYFQKFTTYQHQAIRELDKLYVTHVGDGNESQILLNALAVVSLQNRLSDEPLGEKLPDPMMLFGMARGNNPKQPILLNNIAWSYFYQRDSLNSWHKAHDALNLLSQTSLDPYWTEGMEGYVLPLGENPFQIQWQLQQVPRSGSLKDRAAILKNLLLWNLLNLLGLLTHQAGQPMLGIPFFREAYELFPHLGEGPFHLAMESVRHRDFQAALTWYERALAADPFNGNAWLQWIQILYKTRQISQVRTALAQAKILFQAPVFKEMQVALQEMESALEME